MTDRRVVLSRRGFLSAGLSLGAVAAAGLSGCAAPGSPTAASAPSAQPTAPLTFRIGTPAPAASLDPAVVADAESHRITRQIFEGLIGVDPDSGNPAPLLAESWEVSEDGLTYTFSLRSGVLFHDGTPLTADVVVHNFARWVELADAGQHDYAAFNTVFHHRSPEAPAVTAPETSGTPSLGELSSEIADRIPEPPEAILSGASYFNACSALDDLTVTITLNAPLTGLIQALTVPGLAIAAPTSTPEAPVGTGPYRFVGMQEGVTTLERYADHWREVEGAVDRIELSVLRDAPSRLRELESGEIHGYDTVTVTEMRDLVRRGQQILQRDPFSVLYLGMNQASGPLASLDVRRAASYALHRGNILQDLFIAGTGEARSFLPPSLGVEPPSTYYGHNAAAAAEALEAAGYDGEPIPFLYPRNVTRGYLPLPELVYAEISSQLTAAGFRITPVPLDWSAGYVDAVMSGEHAGFHLLGWTGSYRDPDHFLSSIFAHSAEQFGYRPATLGAHLAAARSMPEGQERNAAYQAIGELIAEDVPALPLAYPISALAMSAAVTSFPSSPVLDESYDRVRLNAS